MAADYGESEVTFNTRPQRHFRLLVPLSWPLMEKGLQGLSSISPDEGMLFPSDGFPGEGNVGMWMGDYRRGGGVKFALAMIWLRADGTVGVVERTEPRDRHTYSHRGIACVEIRQDQSSGIEPGVPYSLK